MGIKLKRRRLGEESRKHFAWWASLEAAALALWTLVFGRVWERRMDAQTTAGTGKYRGTENILRH